MIANGYGAGVSAAPPTDSELASLRADVERLAAEREHYREALSADARAVPQARAGPSRAEVRTTRRQRRAADHGRPGDAARRAAGGGRSTTDSARTRARAAKADRPQAAAGAARPPATSTPFSCRCSRAASCTTSSHGATCATCFAYFRLGRGGASWTSPRHAGKRRWRNQRRNGSSAITSFAALPSSLRPVDTPARSSGPFHRPTEYSRSALGSRTRGTERVRIARRR